MFADNSGVPLSSSDRSFVDAAIPFYRLVIALADLAQARADHQLVTTFAGQMRARHFLALEDLLSYAGGSVDDRFTLPGAYLTLYNQTATQSGSEFDRVYMDAMVQLLQTELNAFAQQGGSLSSPLREHVVDETAQLRSDLQIAREIAARVQGF